MARARMALASHAHLMLADVYSCMLAPLSPSICTVVLQCCLSVRALKRPSLAVGASHVAALPLHATTVPPMQLHATTVPPMQPKQGTSARAAGGCLHDTGAACVQSARNHTRMCVRTSTHSWTHAQMSMHTNMPTHTCTSADPCTDKHAHKHTPIHTSTHLGRPMHRQACTQTPTYALKHAPWQTHAGRPGCGGPRSHCPASHQQARSRRPCPQTLPPPPASGPRAWPPQGTLDWLSLASGQRAWLLPGCPE